MADFTVMKLFKSLSLVHTLGIHLLVDNPNELAVCGESFETGPVIRGKYHWLPILDPSSVCNLWDTGQVIVLLQKIRTPE